MTIQQLIYFREIAKTKHFTRAAENLYVSQSGLSNAILALEKELGISLFIRNNGKTAKMTSFAEKLLPYAERVISNMEEISRIAKEEKNPLCGSVTVAYSFINGFALMPKVFNGFINDPKNESIVVDFKIVHGTKRTDEMIRAGEVDIGFNGAEKGEGIESVPFYRQKLCVYVPAASPLARKRSLTVADIAEEPLICYHVASELYKQISDMYASNGFKMNEIACYDEWSVQLAHVALGAGITIAPGNVPVDRENVRAVPLNDPMAQRIIYMHWSSERMTPPHVKYLKNYCEEYSKRQRLL